MTHLVFCWETLYMVWNIIIPEPLHYQDSQPHSFQFTLKHASQNFPYSLTTLVNASHLHKCGIILHTAKWSVFVDSTYGMLIVLLHH